MIRAAFDVLPLGGLIVGALAACAVLEKRIELTDLKVGVILSGAGRFSTSMRRRPGRSVTSMRPSGRKARPHGTSKPSAIISMRIVWFWLRTI